MPTCCGKYVEVKHITHNRPCHNDIPHGPKNRVFVGIIKILYACPHLLYYRQDMVFVNVL